jgi:hypothetical protein
LHNNRLRRCIWADANAIEKRAEALQEEHKHEKKAIEDKSSSEGHGVDTNTAYLNKNLEGAATKSQSCSLEGKV